MARLIYFANPDAWQSGTAPCGCLPVHRPAVLLLQKLLQPCAGCIPIARGSTIPTMRFADENILSNRKDRDNRQMKKIRLMIEKINPTTPDIISQRQD